jgi:hypothetical protein
MCIAYRTKNIVASVTTSSSRVRSECDKLHGINILIEMFSVFYVFGWLVELMKIDFVRDEKRSRDFCRGGCILFVSQKRGSLRRHMSVYRCLPPKTSENTCCDDNSKCDLALLTREARYTRTTDAINPSFTGQPNFQD